MNKKILLSLAIVSVVAIAATVGTIAYFTDTETSTGNTFTAGTIDLTIDSEASYNGEAVQEATWGQENGIDITSEKFFNFTDVKPGDEGENTISIHIATNEAYVCMAFGNATDDENECTEPELEYETKCEEDKTGELDNNLYFFAWEDDGDNVWEQGEEIMFQGYAPAVLNGQIYSLGTVAPEETAYVGLAWCAGEMTIDEEAYTLTCSGASMNNDVQTDGYTLDVAFYAEQTRNNEMFSCDNWQPEMEEFEIVEPI